RSSEVRAAQVRTVERCVLEISAAEISHFCVDAVEIGRREIAARARACLAQLLDIVRIVCGQRSKGRECGECRHCRQAGAPFRYVHRCKPHWKKELRKTF